MDRKMCLLTWLFLPLGARSVCSEESKTLPREIDRSAYERAVQRGISFLRNKGVAADGSYSSQAGAGITALATTALLRNGVPPSDPTVSRSLEYLERFLQPDGGVYPPNSRLKNYDTCLAVLCFREANRSGRFDQTLKKADAFLKGLQWHEANGKNVSDFGYGGAGYGGDSRPDLSNTNFFVDALRASGNDANSEAIQRALIFISRCQNLESEHNTSAFPAKNPDGGFYYSPIGEGSSPAGKTDNGGLRSYGAMTYAGLKSMIFAGVGPDDPRVKAATTWIKKNYDVKANPGMGSSGYYYYLQLFAKALDALGSDEIVDAAGIAHNWRAELVTELVRRQQPDGSWINSNGRWLEDDANLVTSFALLSLAYCKPK